jgi:hypothetical protein
MQGNVVLWRKSGREHRITLLLLSLATSILIRGHKGSHAFQTHQKRHPLDVDTASEFPDPRVALSLFHFLGAHPGMTCVFLCSAPNLLQSCAASYLGHAGKGPREDRLRRLSRVIHAVNIVPLRKSDTDVHSFLGFGHCILIWSYMILLCGPTTCDARYG